MPSAASQSVRRKFALSSTPLSLAIAGLVLLQNCVNTGSAAEPVPPNLLFIAIDDLNGWVGFLGGHPQVKTPNMDRLAKRGVVFANAHCAAPLSNPSRAAVFSGLPPWESGVLGNDDGDIRKLHPTRVLLPTHFQRAGYRTFGTGKLLHQKGTGLFDEEFFSEQRWSPFAPKAVDYTPDELPSKSTDNPRHLVRLGGRQIGLMIDALDAGPNATDTEIVLWGDHGWHLGEKQHWGKWTGWQRSTRVPLIIAPSQRDQRFHLPARTAEPASLLDLYPTLIELSGVPARDDLSGTSLVPQLRDPAANAGRSVISTFDAGNHAVIDARWRYIRYADGSEELYDTQLDPNEWVNLADRPEHRARMQELARRVPAR